MSFNLKSKGKFAALLAALIISVSVTGCANTDEKHPRQILQLLQKTVFLLLQSLRMNLLTAICSPTVTKR